MTKVNNYTLSGKIPSCGKSNPSIIFPFKGEVFRRDHPKTVARIAFPSPICPRLRIKKMVNLLRTGQRPPPKGEPPVKIRRTCLKSPQIRGFLGPEWDDVENPRGTQDGKNPSKKLKCVK